MLCPDAEEIIKDTSIDTYAVLRFLRQEVRDFIPPQLPVVGISASGVKVYKYIQFDPKEVKRTIKINAKVFKPTNEIRNIKTFQHLKFTTFLNTYLGLKNSSLKDNEIRDLANKMQYSLIEGTTEFIVCKTLQDHSDLYTKTHAQSCMSPKDNYSVTRLKTHLYKNYGLWPSMWYYYNPHTKGAYLQVRGRSVARCILLRSDTKTKFRNYYDCIYGESEYYSDLLEDILKDKGYTKRNSISINTVFKVPAIRVLAKAICPLPFHDCINSYPMPYRCYYNKEENAFYFGPTKKLPGSAQELDDSYEYNGYLDSELRPAHDYLSI